jgi:uncharacterized membrane protein YfhO
VAHVDAPGRCILAFTERFHDGWSVTVDGAPRPTVRVEGDFLGVPLEKGVQRVTLRFMPRSFVYGAIASASGVVLLAGILIATWAMAGRRTTADGPAAAQPRKRR